jgi:hypothetical protein
LESPKGLKNGEKKEFFFLKEKEKKENGFKKLSKSKIHNENKRSFAK